MKLKFLGRGSCFAKDHASAFFVTKDRDFVLIDCPELAYERIKTEFNLSKYNGLYVYVTHTHCDHISGLGEFVQYAYYALNKHVNIVAPSTEVEADLKMLLNIEAVEEFMYTLTSAFEIIPALTTKPNPIIPENVSAISIPTKHVAPLEGKCFGFQFKIDDVIVVYTGDTAIIDPFIPFLKNEAELYIDTSVAYKSDVHLWFDDMLPTLISLTQKGVKIYLMHLDDAKKAEKLVENIPGIEVVQIV